MPSGPGPVIVELSTDAGSVGAIPVVSLLGPPGGGPPGGGPPERPACGAPGGLPERPLCGLPDCGPGERDPRERPPNSVTLVGSSASSFSLLPPHPIL